MSFFTAEKIVDGTTPTILATVKAASTAAVATDTAFVVAISPNNSVGITGTVTANQGTSPWVTSLASTTITGTVAVTGTFFQATQPISGTVTANQGTSPWVVSLASTTITGTVAVTQSTSPWVVSGTVTTTPPANASTNLTQVAGVTLGATAVTAYGVAPAAASVPGVNAFITNTVPVTLSSTTITGTVAVTQSTSPWVVSLTSTTITGTVAENLTQVAGVTLGATAVTNFGSAPAATVVPGVNSSIFAGTTGITATGTSLNANITNTVPVTLASTTVTNTVADNLTQVAGVVLGATAVTAYGSTPAAANVPGVNAFITNTVPVTLTSTTITGTSTVAGNKTNNNAAPGATNVGTLSALANAAPPTWTEGNQVALSVELKGKQRVLATDNGTFVGFDGISNSQLAYMAMTGVQNTGPLIVGSNIYNGSTWDRLRSATIGNAVAATGIAASAAYGEYLSTAPAPTTGQYSSLQTDYTGSLFVKPYRRSQTVAQATACTTTAPTTVLAAQAAGIFADITTLILTVLAVAVDVNFTVTLSDGTISHVFNLNTGGVTSPSPGTQLAVSFNPPLPATTAATAWTLAMSTAETVNVTIVAVLQKAS